MRKGKDELCHLIKGRSMKLTRAKERGGGEYIADLSLKRENN